MLRGEDFGLSRVFVCLEVAMAIYKGMAALRVRSDAEPMFIHPACKQELHQIGGAQDQDQQAFILKCTSCDVVVGEWPTQKDKERELAIWVEQNFLH
jgi:hypothetical protein